MAKKSAISKYLAQIGKKGGLTKGPTKARDPEKMKKAAEKRWEKRREKPQGKTPESGEEV